MTKLLLTLIIVASMLGCQENPKIDLKKEADSIAKVDSVNRIGKKLFSESQIQFKLDSLSKRYKGKRVVIEESKWFKAKNYPFKFLRDTTTLWEIAGTTLKAGDIVFVIGKTPVNNDRVEIKKDGIIGYVEYYDINVFQSLIFKDPDFN